MAFRPTSQSVESAVIPSVLPAPLGPDSKWLLASHLQKSIRRSLPEEAMWAATELIRIDEAYLRYRLAVIAVEDVAGASPQTVAEHWGEGWTKKALAARGGSPFLIDTAVALAQAIKDRTPCTWMNCARHLADFESAYGPWEALSVPVAQRLAFEASEWWVQGLAAWRAIGTVRFPSGHLPKVEGDWPGWLALASERLPGEPRQKALLAGASQREAHPVFLALAWAAQDAQGVKDVVQEVLSLGKAGPWLSAAVDKHTREGLTALRRLTGTASGRAWGEQYGLNSDALADAVGRLWFWIDGGSVAHVRRYPMALLIEQEAKRDLASRIGVPGATLFERWGRDPTPMHAARIAAVGATSEPAPRRPHP